MNRATELSIEIAIAVAFAVGVVVLAIYVPYSQWPDKKWGGAAISTIMVFGYILHWNRRMAGRWSFWGLFIAVFVIHCAAWLALLTRIGSLPLVLFAVTATVEGLLVSAAIERALGRQ
jgi:hypothetical protein